MARFTTPVIRQIEVVASLSKDELIEALKCATIHNRNFDSDSWSLADVLDLQNVANMIGREMQLKENYEIRLKENYEIDRSRKN